MFGVRGGVRGEESWTARCLEDSERLGRHSGRETEAPPWHSQLLLCGQSFTT